MRKNEGAYRRRGEKKLLSQPGSELRLGRESGNNFLLAMKIKARNVVGKGLLGDPGSELRLGREKEEGNSMRVRIRCESTNK